MKKIKTIGVTIILSSFLLYSCGGDSIQSDAKKVAELQCEYQNLLKKATTGDLSSITESANLMTKVTELVTELEGKYSTAGNYEKFQDALAIELKECDNKN